MKLTLLFLTLFSCSLLTNAQTAPCPLTIDQAPAIRGFKLGQTVAEIDKRIPIRQLFIKRKIADIHEYGEYGLVALLTGDILIQPGIDRAKYPELLGVQIDLEFLDEKLVRIDARYYDYQPDRLCT